MGFIDFFYIYASFQTMSKSKKITKRRKRSKSIAFKLSYRQYQSLQNYSQLHNSSPITVIKERIRDCIEEYSNEQIGKFDIPKNQLNLFHHLKQEEQQLGLFD